MNKTLDSFRSAMPTIDVSKFEPPDIEPIPPELSKDRIKYEDTVLKDFAEEIKAVQLETNRQLALLIEENRKADLISRELVTATLVVSVLTLIATVVGIFL